MSMTEEELKLFNLLKKTNYTPKQLSSELGLSVKEINSLVKDMIGCGVPIEKIKHGRTFYYHLKRHGEINEAVYKERISLNLGDGYIHFGLIADTHLCSKKEDLDSLNAYYDEVARRGIKVVYHCGDISDGQDVYRGQLSELKVWGVAKQAEYIIKNYPKRKGVVTKFITGNHDLRAMEKQGVDIGALIVNGVQDPDTLEHIPGRKDMVYLGQMYARVEVAKGVYLDLVHADGGMSYAVSYKAQKYIDALEGGSKPNLLGRGHLHQAMYFDHRNIHVFEAGCFQRQTIFLKRKGITPKIGGWIIHAKIEKGSVVRVIPEYIKFY